MQFDWRVSEGANTGVKYRLQRTVFLDPSKEQEGPFESTVQQEIGHSLSGGLEMLAHARTTGQISLQYHGDKVWFKNLKIKPM